MREIHLVIQKYKSAQTIAEQKTENELKQCEKRYKEQFLNYTKTLDAKLKRQKQTSDN